MDRQVTSIAHFRMQEAQASPGRRCYVDLFELLGISPLVTKTVLRFLVDEDHPCHRMWV
jgi:hypothetical protein